MITSIEYQFKKKLDFVAKLTGYQRGCLIDRAIKIYLTEYIDEYLLPGWGGNTKMAEIVRYVCRQLRITRKALRRNAFKWWLDGFCYLKQDLKRGFKEDMVFEKNYKVYHGVITWFDYKRCTRGRRPYKFQLVPIQEKICRIPVGAFYEVY